MIGITRRFLLSECGTETAPFIGSCFTASDKPYQPGQSLLLKSRQGGPLYRLKQELYNKKLLKLRNFHTPFGGRHLSESCFVCPGPGFPFVEKSRNGESRKFEDQHLKKESRKI